MIALFIIFRSLFGWWSASVATDKGRPYWRWFAAGFCFGLLGVIVAYCVRDLKKAAI